jgi:DNA-directed RNA polymerase III subunit RPC4
MTASGPFSLGPSAMSTPRVPATAPQTPAVSAKLKREKDKAGEDLVPKDEENAYSDPDDGVKIVDMDEIRYTDRLVPESLVNERSDRRRRGICVEEEEYIEDLIDYFTQTRLDEVRDSSRLLSI